MADRNDERRARLAAALRANLKRRKAAGADESGGGEPADKPEGAPRDAGDSER